MKNVFKNRLTDQYHFIDKTSVNPNDIINLRQSVGWDIDSFENWKSYINQSIAVIGVCNSDNLLVGAAFLVGNLRHAVVCDLTVNPEHQRKGVGESIIYKIMYTINELGILYIYTELAETNPFRNKMMQSGFEVTGGSLFLDTTQF